MDKFIKQNLVFKTSLNEFFKKNKVIVICLIFGFFMSSISLFQKEPPQEENKKPTETADTFIPSGYVLVPITVSNYESVNGLLGSYGVVDLFIPKSENNTKSQKIANQIKIIRAPLDPNQFAILVPESETDKILSHDGSFHVVVQNPKQNKMKFTNNSKKIARIIGDNI